jgi:hypothetical protein
MMFLNFTEKKLILSEGIFVWNAGHVNLTALCMLLQSNQVLVAPQVLSTVSCGTQNRHADVLIQIQAVAKIYGCPDYNLTGEYSILG